MASLLDRIESRLTPRAVTGVVIALFVALMAYQHLFLAQMFVDETGFLEMVKPHAFRGFGDLFVSMFSEPAQLYYGGFYWFYLKFWYFFFGAHTLMAIRCFNSMLLFAPALMMFFMPIRNQLARVLYTLLVLSLPMSYWFIKMTGPEPLQIFASSVFALALMLQPNRPRWMYLGMFALGFAIGIKANAIPLLLAYWGVFCAWRIVTGRMKLSTFTGQMALVVLGFAMANPVTFISPAAGFSIFASDAAKPISIQAMLAGEVNWSDIIVFAREITVDYNWNRDYAFHGGIFPFSVHIVAFFALAIYLLASKKLPRLLFAAFLVAAAGELAIIVLRPRHQISYFVWYWFPVVPLLLAATAASLRDNVSRRQLGAFAGIVALNLALNSWHVWFTVASHQEFDYGMAHRDEVISCIRSQLPPGDLTVRDYGHRFSLMGQFAAGDCLGFPHMHCEIPPGPKEDALLFADKALALFDRYNITLRGFDRYTKIGHCPGVSVFVDKRLRPG